MKNGAIAILGFAAFALALCAPGAHAAGGPQLLITWKATGSAAPANYAGKILPGVGTPVTASVAVISAGRPVNLSGRTIYWYLDDNFLAGGIGTQTIVFNAVGHVEIMALRAEIVGYPGGSLISTVHIPVANPQVVIVAPYADNMFSGPAVMVHAEPYYFPVIDLPNLVLAWSVNGQSVTNRENPEDLTINVDASTPAGYSLLISLGAQLSDNPLAVAEAGVTLTANQ